MLNSNPEKNVSRFRAGNAIKQRPFRIAYPPPAAPEGRSRLQQITVKGHAQTFMPRGAGYDVAPLAFARVDVLESRATHRSFLPGSGEARGSSFYLDPDSVYTLGVVQTLSDATGRFQCVFNWWPQQASLDSPILLRRPVIVVRVKHDVEGVARTLYMDPYSRTRWYSRYAHVDLSLHSEPLQCEGRLRRQDDAFCRSPAPPHPWW